MDTLTGRFLGFVGETKFYFVPHRTDRKTLMRDWGVFWFSMN